MNLRRTDDGGRTFGPDLEVIRDLVEDYARTDSWDVVDALPAELHARRGDRGPVRSVFRVGSGAYRAASPARNSDISVHVVEDAGHWVHVDAADALVALLSSPRKP